MAGAGVYTYQLVRALPEVLGDHHLTVLTRAGLFDDLTCDRVEVLHVERGSRPARLAWEQCMLPRLLRRHKIDVLHSPHHHTPLFVGTKRVVTFHDLTFLLLPERYSLVRRSYMSAVTRAAARVADAIITPSRAVRDDVIERLGVAAERLVAIPEAAGPQYAPADGVAQQAARQKHGLPEGYVLSVGSLEPGKNRATLLRAVARLGTESADCVLAVVGQPAWDYEQDYDLVRELGLEERVRFLGYVPDEDMPALYSGARLLAFPSLYEGFGLPVLEAMACGTPVVTSDGSAMAEVAGDAALLVDPRDVGALADAIGRLLADDVLHADLHARGLARAQEFSWRRTARETLSVYERVGRI